MPKYEVSFAPKHLESVRNLLQAMKVSVKSFAINKDADSVTMLVEGPEKTVEEYFKQTKTYLKMDYFRKISE